MSGRASKKGRNPGAVDNWLDSIGLYRKNVAYDETCLFRAVSEQLFDCQIYHERVRRECVDYGRKNYCEFWNMLEDEDQWYDHMEMLEKHMVVCGNIEIQLISRKYNRDVLVFDASHKELMDCTKRNLEKPLMLCLMGEDHYDVVYRKEHIQNSGMCQSIVYNILYENVFEISDVQDIVQGMLYEKEFVPPSEINNNALVEYKPNSDSSGYSKIVAFNVNGPTSPPNIAPFPFKVAKALDPTIYRNIEYDSWTEVRREMRLGDWYYGDDNLILGTRCILNDDDATYECYIQEIIKDENKCVVYVTKLAEKRTVNYTDLSPENDAKPWPLPYRFTKNVNVATSAESQTSDRASKSPRRRRSGQDRRRTKSNSDSSNLQLSGLHQTSECAIQGVKAYVGAPLQMQDNQNDTAPSYNSSSANDSPAQDKPETSLSQHNLLVTPDVPSPMPKFSWDTPWNSYVPVGSDQVAMWPHTPPIAQNVVGYNVKPMVASAPVTPDVVPYHDYPLVYNYQYNSWHHHHQVETAYAAAQSHQPEMKPEIEEIYETEVNVVDCDQRAETNGPGDQYASPVYVDGYERANQEARPTLCTTLTPPSPQVEVYSPLLPMAPGTPVIYTHTPEVQEVMYPTAAVPMYSTTPEVQYVTSNAFMYPPTPPTAWYPPGINMQGFIFPQPVNQNGTK